LSILSSKERTANWKKRGERERKNEEEKTRKAVEEERGRETEQETS
jgi:hypothetical protein